MERRHERSDLDPLRAVRDRCAKAHGDDAMLANGSVVSIALFFLVVCIIFSVATDAFLTSPNLLNILRQSAPLLIVAAAMTFVITTGGIDLSVGSVLALVATLSATLLQARLALAGGHPRHARARRRCSARCRAISSPMKASRPSSSRLPGFR